MFSAFDPPEPNSARFKSFHVIAAKMSLAEKMAKISMAITMIF